MMSTWGNSARVGLVVVLAAVVFGYGWTFFRGLNRHTYTLHVRFDDASGLLPDVPVQLAGVQIGRVADIALRANRADVAMEIQDKFQIPNGSRFAISTPILGTTSVITVIPPADATRRPNDVIAPDTGGLVGERQGDLSASFSRANALLDQIMQTAKKTDKLLDATTRLAGSQALQKGLKQSVANVKLATANAAKLSARLNTLLVQDNAEVQALLRQTRVGSSVALNNIADTTGQIRQITRENRSQLNAIISNLNDTTASVALITSQTGDLLKKGDIQKNLVATTANLKTASDNIAKLSGDQGLQGDLRATLTNIRLSTEKTNTLLERLNQLAGVRPKTASGTPPRPAPAPVPAAAPLLLPRADFLQNTRADRFRLDVDAIASLPKSPTAFARAGIYGVGDQSRVTLQYGRFLAPNSLADYRVGLYASKLAVGGDLGLGRGSTLSVELFDPNRARLDVRATQMLSPTLGFVIGGEDITRRSSGAVIGLQYRHSK